MLVTLSVGGFVEKARLALETTDYMFTSEELMHSAIHCINGDIDCAMDNLFHEIHQSDPSLADLPYDTPSDLVLMNTIKAISREINTTLYRLCNDVMIPRFVEAGKHHLTLSLEQ